MKDNPGHYKNIQQKHPNESWDRDEYPPASTYQGGKGAGVRPILSHDNQGSGSSWWRHGTRGMKDGDPLHVRPVKPKGAGSNWGLPSHMR